MFKRLLILIILASIIQPIMSQEQAVLVEDYFANNMYKWWVGRTSIAKAEIWNNKYSLSYNGQKSWSSNIKVGLLPNSDFVIEGSDNLQTKILVNDACVNLKIPFTIAGAIRFNGQIISVNPKEKTTCYRCVFGDIQEDTEMGSCSQVGVMGATTGIVGTIQASESIKHILKVGETLTNKMLFIDILTNTFHHIEVKRNPDCLACGDNAVDLIKTYDYNMEDVCKDG